MLNSQAFNALYQIYYPDTELPYLLPTNLPLLNFLMGGTTDGQISGFITDMPWLGSAAAGVSQTFTVAQQASNNAPTALRPQIRLSQVYKLVDFSDKDELLSQGEAAYGQLMETTMRGARLDVLNKIDQLAHGAGNGVRNACTVTTTNSTLITLDTMAAETIYELNDRVVITSTNVPDGSVPTIAAGPFTITSVGQNTITLSSPTSVTAGANWVALLGDTLGFSTAMLEPAVVGVGAYNPFTTPTPGESFLGVDRSVFPNRFSGYRSIGTTRSLEAADKRLATLMHQGGVNPDGGMAMVCHNPVDFDALEDKLASYQRITQSEIGVFFFDAIALNSPLGRLTVVSDPHQTQGYSRIYVAGGMEMQYKDGLPHLAKLSNGQDEEFGQNFDGRSVRLRGYPQIRCIDPRKQGITSLPTIT